MAGTNGSTYEFDDDSPPSLTEDEWEQLLALIEAQNGGVERKPFLNVLMITEAAPTLILALAHVAVKINGTRFTVIKDVRSNTQGQTYQTDVFPYFLRILEEHHAQ